MALAREEAERMAQLAALSLAEEDAERVREDLAAMVGYFDKVLSLDLAEVPPTERMAAGAAPLRPDVVKPSLPPEEALANAPEREGTSLLVPRIIE